MDDNSLHKAYTNGYKDGYMKAIEDFKIVKIYQTAVDRPIIIPKGAIKLDDESKEPKHE